MVRPLLALLLAAHAALAAEPAKVFRYAFPTAETTLDPQKGVDLYSNILHGAVFETPLKYDYLARPLKLKPNTLAAMPEVSADGLTYTLRVKPGIYFADDPAFEGKKRELVAQDFVYSLKRLLDPRLRAPLLSEVEGIVAGTTEALAAARKADRLDYDAPVEGLRVVDRYTFQVKLTQPFALFIYNFADCRLACPLAREVVERYGDDVGSHPVGTGPFRLAFWKRSAKLVYERNPGFREETFDAEPAAGDAEGQAILARLKGRRLPMVDRVEVAIIEETQPRWLSFLNEEMDLVFAVPNEFAYTAFPNNRLAANLARRGIGMSQTPGLDLTYDYFNMEDPVVGGYMPERVALRRAISLAYKTADEIAIIRKGQALPAQTPFSPGVVGYDPAFRTNAGEYDLSKAKALLDMYGYVDRDGDGWREQPDGSRLEIAYNSQPTSLDQQYDQLWKRSLDDLGIRMSVRKAKWPDMYKEALAGRLMMWQLGGSASAPDADTWLSSLYGKNIGLTNIARFHHPEYDRLYEKARITADERERTRLYKEMTRIVLAYAPWKVHVHRIYTDMWQPWVVGYRRPLVQNQNFWKYLDIDPARRRQ